MRSVPARRQTSHSVVHAWIMPVFESVPDPFRLRQYLLKARRESAGYGDAAIRRRVNHLEVNTFPASLLFGNLDA